MKHKVSQACREFHARTVVEYAEALKELVEEGQLHFAARVAMSMFQFARVATADDPHAVLKRLDGKIGGGRRPAAMRLGPCSRASR